nr:PREDICTED: pre-rRNA processing protein FTSJ3-like [Latimeria chalumnae]|eukprot:XP_006014611.2 PREDICTED: pre-rRNA processing protein FTSJ3-like [Latimeria chalumnae]
MDLPGVSIADEGETGMFSLKSISQTKLLNEITKGDMKSADAILADAEGGDDIYLSDADDGGEDNVSLASDLDPVDLQDVRQREAARKTGAQKKKVKFSPHEGASEEEEGENPLLVQLEDKTTRQERQTDLWFAKDVFASVDLDADEDLEIRQATKLYAQRGGVITGEGQKGLKQKGKLSPTAIQEEEVAGAERKQEAGNDNDDDDTEDSSSDDDENHIQALKQQMGKHGGIPAADDENDDFEVVPVERTVKHAQILDPEGLALGTIIATSKKRKRDLIDNSFNRYTFNEGEEDEIPDWFQDDEKKHRRRPVPLDRSMVEEYKQRWREINARPIKKVAEAKARKKRRMLKKLEQAKKKAEAVVNTVDISEREKMSQLKSIYKKAGVRKEKREVTYVVAKKGAGQRVRRPAGVKGHFKVVDSRLKKDVRAQNRKKQSGKGRRKK